MRVFAVVCIFCTPVSLRFRDIFTVAIVECDRNFPPHNEIWKVQSAKQELPIFHTLRILPCENVTFDFFPRNAALETEIVAILKV
jgi:hypothetical protein